ncbi:PDZ domain-containing protein [Thalassoroseus pseudoceratinae]|uniref:PDZ domain-containing protein n=1 Tax=Thalassoroseus pseudoceratinae TaxID=2713176 RepID=UPI0014231F0F|nr:PDZ domain-containing protein [Thalassoroseus pseudoceratinae]
MPADDSFWRNPKKLHIWFAFSSLGLLFVTLAMMAGDHSDQWRDYQKTFDQINAIKLETAIESEQGGEYQARVEQLQTEIDQAESNFSEEKQKIDQKIAELSLDADNLSRRVRAQRAVRDKARADYDLAIRDEKTALAAQLREDFDREQQRVDELELALSNIETEIKEQKQELAKQTVAYDQATEELKQFQAEVERLQAAKSKVDPDNWFSSTKRSIMQLPIIDGFNSPHQVKQIWLPDLKITLGMAHTARFDRCTTCHLGIDQVEAGNKPAYPAGHPESEEPADWVAANEFPQPFSTHPNPDLYLTATSPHPTQTFGCTACHEGQGSGTTFSNAAHTPNNPSTGNHWEEEYHFHPNHYWEYPMLPERFQESSCLKCHHGVTELATSPKFGNSAPKVTKGFETIGTFGCFGCHEINGYAGSQSIGPDLRLEPNWYAVAQQVKAAVVGVLKDMEPDAEESGQLKQIADLADHVADAPFESATERSELQSMLVADRQLLNPKLSQRTHNLAAELADVEHIGKYRKVGPALRHIHHKTTDEWVAYWTENPSRFRPSTKMPQFFHLTNLDDATAKRYQPYEIQAISEYLLNKSKEQPFDMLAPAKDYKPDTERGRELFAERGCLACHSHSEFPSATANFGPKLDRVHAKLKEYDPAAEDFTQSEAFRWLYTWLRDPQRYHKRTRMPNLYLDAYESADGEETQSVDPAADIAAWLLQKGPEKFEAPSTLPVHLGLVVEDRAFESGVLVTEVLRFSPATRAEHGEGEDKIEWPLLAEDVILEVGGREVTNSKVFRELVNELDEDERVSVRVQRAGTEKTVTVIAQSPLQDLMRLYLSKTLTNPQVEDTFTAHAYPFEADMIKGDEIELVPGKVDGEKLSDEDWKSMQMAYLGRRTISRYGCYGCHDIPGFESAKPIGTSLQDWGRKDTSKLATEHIAEFLHHNGHGDELSTSEQVEQAMKSARADEFASEEEREKALSMAYYYESLAEHGRPGFIWQKLHAPRSYDYHKTETKGYDERLRMPKFPFDEAQIESVITFVLGLVAEPPAEQYLYQPEGADKARYEGEFLLKKYNCTSCHMLDLPEMQIMVDRESDDTPSTYADMVGMTQSQMLDWFVENRKALLDDATDPPEYPKEIQQVEELAKFFGLETDIPGIAQLADTGKSTQFRANLETFFKDHPELRLQTKPDVSKESPHGILKFLNFRERSSGEVDKTTDDGDAIFAFHGLQTDRLVLDDPENPNFKYQLWEPLEIGGKVYLPGVDAFNFTQSMVADEKPARGGDFAQWLVGRIDEKSSPADQGTSASITKAWQMVPPPLYGEGKKVQTAWLYRFLKNPDRLRWMAVLRMPQFNLSDQEARSLANYFAAADDADFPYQDIPEREEPYLNHKEQELHAFLEEQNTDYLNQSWDMLGKHDVCIKCHSIMGRQFNGTGDSVTRGPDLRSRTSDRLRPEWLELWFYNPKWSLPYTAMLAPSTNTTEGYFKKDPEWQVTGLRDAIMNYDQLIQKHGIVEAPAAPQTNADPAENE